MRFNTSSAAVARLKQIERELEQIASHEHPSRSDNLRAAALAVESDEVNQQVVSFQRRENIAKGRAKGVRIVSGSQGTGDDYDRDSFREPDSVEDHRFRNPWDLSDLRVYGREPGDVATELRSRALSAIEKMPVASDNIRQAATHIIERFDSKDSRLARHCLVTSKPAYVRAWSKLACAKGNTLTVDEQRALSDVEEFRAMSLTDTAGGFLAPFQLDPTVIVTSAGVRSDIRQVARQVVATSDVWHGVSSTNVSWSFDPEGTEVSDDSTAWAQPTIPNYMARGFVPISIEAMQDEINVAQDVGLLLAGGKLDLEGTKFILGSGTAEPTGVITALVAAGGSVITNTATASTFALGDVYTLQGALPARHRAAASWLGNNTTFNKIRQFDVYGGGGFWTNLTGDRPASLMMRDALEAEALVTTTTTGSKILVFGDFQNFVLTDRLGLAVEFVPTLFGANRRPSGQRGWFAMYRTGSGCVNPDAFRLLNVA